MFVVSPFIIEHGVRVIVGAHIKTYADAQRPQNMFQL